MNKLKRKVTVRKLSITVPEDFCQGIDEHFTTEFGVPKGVYSQLITMLIGGWLEEKKKKPKTPLDVALGDGNDSSK